MRCWLTEASFSRMFCHTSEIGVRRTAKTVRVGERFGEIGFGKAKESDFRRCLVVYFSPSVRIEKKYVILKVEEVVFSSFRSPELSQAI